MKKTFLLKTTFYLGVILLFFMISISFNSLRVLTLNSTKAIYVAQDRFKLDELESQIKNAINNKPINQAFSLKIIEELDESFLRFEKRLEGQNLPLVKNVKEKWEQLKNQVSPDPTEIINELEILHRMINKIALEDIEKRGTRHEKDLSRLRVLKIASGVLIILLLFIAMYIDTIQSKQKEELIKKLQDYENREGELLNPGANSISPENSNNFFDRI